MKEYGGVILNNVFRTQINLFRTILFALALFVGQFSVSNAADTSVISTEYGKIQGTVEDTVACYKGIPYAAPPVGELRWMPPVPAKPWDGIRSTKVYAEEAAQNAELGVFASPGGSEDCLYLNVFVPEEAAARGKPLPVFFWIHGGGLFVGSANDYNPLPLAQIGEAVVVTVNYRLGAFGFFAHPAIDAENHAIANYGLMDQIAALEWVKKNIANFGGDPENVTIAGESSGGQSVLALMTSPRAEGLFQSAIAMSGCTVTLHSDFTSYTKEQAEKIGIALAEKAGLKNATADELRSLPTEAILASQVPFGTFTVDGDYVPEHIGDSIAHGHVHDVVFVNGTTRNEGSFFAGMMESLSGKVMTAEDYKKNVADISQSLGNHTPEEILAEYPLAKYSTPAEAYAAIITDAWFAATAQRVNKALWDKIPVYAYEFDDQTAPLYLPTSFKQGAAHTYELPYIFRGFHGSSELSTKLSARQEKLSEEMIKLWTHVRDLPQQKKWKRYNPQKDNFLKLTLPKAKMESGKFADAHHTTFWDKGECR